MTEEMADRINIPFQNYHQITVQHIASTWYPIHILTVLVMRIILINQLHYYKVCINGIHIKKTYLDSLSSEQRKKTIFLHHENYKLIILYIIGGKNIFISSQNNELINAKHCSNSLKCMVKNIHTKKHSMLYAHMKVDCSSLSEFLGRKCSVPITESLKLNSCV